MFQNHQSSHNRNKMLRQTSSLFRLDPFLDERGMLRVGGRLQKTALAFEIKHPIVWPKKSHVTKLLIRQDHSQEQHLQRTPTSRLLDYKQTLLCLPSFPKVYHLSQAPWNCSSSKDGEPPRRTYFSRRTFHIL